MGNPSDDTFYKQITNQVRGTNNNGLPKLGVVEDRENDLLRSRINELLAKNDPAIQRVARQSFEKRISNRNIPIIPLSHEWDDIDKRILFFRNYIEADGAGENKESLINLILVHELKYEDAHNIKEKVRRDLLTKNLKKINPKYRVSQALPKSKLEEELNSYFESGLEPDNLRKLIKRYYATLSDMVFDLEELEEFLFKESSTHIGQFVTWIGVIERPDWIRDNEIIKKADLNLTKAIRGYLETTYTINGRKYTSEKLSVEETLQRLAQIEIVLSIVSEKLSTFQTVSIDCAHRMALYVQILMALVPAGNIGNIKLYQSFLLAAASNFSYAITDKLIHDKPESWVKTLGMAGGKSILDIICQKAVSRYLQLPNVSTLSKVAINTGIDVVTNAVTNSILDAFKGATFGEALLNLYKTITDPEQLLLSAVSQATGGVSKKTDSNGAPIKGKTKQTIAVPEIFKKPVNKFIVAMGLVLPVAPAHTNSKKPTVNQIDKANSKKATVKTESTPYQRSTVEQGTSIENVRNNSSIDSAATKIEGSGTLNKGTDDKKTATSKPELPPSNRSLPPSLFLLAIRSRRANGIDFDFISSEKDSIEFNEIRIGDWLVYTFHDVSGAVIYVGITQKAKSMKAKRVRDAIKRFQEHLVKKDGEFIGDASTVKIRGVYDDKLPAHALEQDFINEHNPKYNADITSWDSYKAGGHPKAKVTKWADIGMSSVEVPKTNRDITFRIKISNP